MSIDSSDAITNEQIMSPSSKMYNFLGKVALVTGSSSCIGEAIAVQFASYGAKVTITGRLVENLDKVGKRIEEVSGGTGNSLKIVGDLLDVELPEKLIQQTIDKFGQLDILVNNAGGGNPGDSGFDNQNLLNAYDKVMGLNVRSVLQLTQLAVPHLEKTKENVINISSVAAMEPMSIVYSTSKAALDMLTKTSAAQLAPKGIRVNSINPGPVKTAIFRSMGIGDMLEEQLKPIMDDMVQKYCPLKRLAEPVEIANLASFLASDEAINMTGSIVVSDSGMLVRAGFQKQD